MKVWIITLISTYIICSIANYFPSVKYNRWGELEFKPNILIAVLACGVLVFVSGLRQGIGDTETYKYSFTLLPSSFSEYMKTLKYEGDWAFDFFGILIKTLIKDDAKVMIFIWSLVTIVCIFAAFYKYSCWLEMAVFLFITTGCYLTSMNGIRQYIASSILFLAFPLIEERKWYLYFPIVLFVAQFHSSAYIFIPLYFVVNRKAWGAVTKGMLAVGVVLFLTYGSTGPMIANLLHESQYGNYSDLITSTGAGANILRAVVMLVPVVLSFMGRDVLRENVKYYDILVNFSVINFISILLATRYWIYARFNMYFSLYMVLLLCECIQKIFNDRSQRMVTMLCLACYFIYYWYEMNISLGFGADYVHFIPF